METSFLEKLALHIHQTHPGPLDKLCFVFPSKRSGLFFKKELAKLRSKSFWAPQILTIDSFIESLSGLSVMGPLEQIFQLYSVHQKLKIQPQLNLENFIDQGKIILADFNDIDMALAEVNDLFRNVKEYVQLENWDPSRAPENSLTSKYLETFENLPRYYAVYQESLLAQGKAYQGLVYRHLKNQIKNGETDKINQFVQGWDKIYVGGLNALTPAEKWLFDWFTAQGKLELFFEAEQQMISDPDQESGYFIRKFATEQKQNFRWSLDHLTDSKKDIHTYAVNGNLAMARMVGELFQENPALTNGNETAIILADESLLMPVLESLPPSLGEVNVTLGFPLSLTSFMSFSEQIFGMQKLANVRQGVRQFYFKDIMKVLTNPVLVAIYGNEKAYSDLAKKIIALNKVWVDTDYLQAQFAQDSVFDGIVLAFSNWRENPLNAMKYLHFAIDRFQENMESSQIVDDVLTEQMYFFKTSLIKLQQYFDQFDQDLSMDAIRRLFKQVVSPMQVPFSGEPLAGIQIMGLLETRLLSFKNIVFVSVNEGVIPSKAGYQSLLPFSLRRGFNIQTHQERESLFAYHFYRILSQAENIHLIYDTSSEGVGSKEKSRFIRQIEHEWPEKSAHIQFTHHVGVFEDESKKTSDRIEKSPEVIANITKYLTQRGLSPSALNNFVESPIDFYYGNVLGIREPKSVDEDVEHNTFGTIVHACLEEFYKPFEKQVLKARALEVAFKSVDAVIEKEFTKEIPHFYRGKHYLSFYAVKNYVKRFIQLDIQFIKECAFPTTLYKNEMRLTSTLNVNGVVVKLGGISDRVETRGGVHYIIDYKTGSVKSSDIKVEHLDDLATKYQPKLVQLLMYAWLANRTLDAPKVVSGIYTLRDTKLNLLKAQIGDETEFNRENLHDFESFLTGKIQEMLDPEIPLIKNPDYQFALF